MAALILAHGDKNGLPNVIYGLEVGCLSASTPKNEMLCVDFSPFLILWQPWKTPEKREKQKKEKNGKENIWRASGEGSVRTTVGEEIC